MNQNGLILPDDNIITDNDAEIIDIESMIIGVLHTIEEISKKFEILHEKQMELENRLEILEKTEN